MRISKQKKQKVENVLILLLLSLPFPLAVTLVVRAVSDGVSWATLSGFISLMTVSVSAVTYVFDKYINPQLWSIYCGHEVSVKLNNFTDISRPDDIHSGFYRVEGYYDQVFSRIDWLSKNLPKDAWYIDMSSSTYRKIWQKVYIDLDPILTEELKRSSFVEGNDLQFKVYFRDKNHAVLFKLTNA